MHYNREYYPQNLYGNSNMYRQGPQNYGNNRPVGGFLFPFALGLGVSPLIFGNPRPPRPYPYPPRPYPYYYPYY